MGPRAGTVSLLLLSTGCTFSPGGGFGEVVGGGLAAELDALDLETADGQVVAVESAVLGFDAVELQALQGAEGVDFDPAAPPEGYTLCHGDHCHSTSGELISYDVIIAELSGGTARFESVGALEGMDGLGLLDAGPSPLAGTASLPLMDLSQVALPAPRIALSGRAGDGTRVEIELRLEERLLGEMLYEMTRTGPPQLRLDVEVFVPDTLLLGVDVAAASEAGELRIDDPEIDPGGAVAEALRTTVVHGALSPVE